MRSYLRGLIQKHGKVFLNKGGTHENCVCEGERVCKKVRVCVRGCGDQNIRNICVRTM